MPLTQVSSRLIEDTLRYVLGASGTNHYTFTGKGLTGAVNDPTLTLSRGHTYVFENRNSSGAHPFYIKTSIANGGTNDAYNTGVTNNGGAGGTEIVFTVPHDAPDLLYYQCSSHSSMAGQLKIAGAVADGSITESKLADDAVTADKLANSINSAIAANTAKTSLEDNSVTTTKIADEAVTLAKLEHGTSSNDGKFLRANNGADPSFETIAQPDLTNLSASNLTSGTVPDARFPATLPAISGANLTNLPAGGKVTRVFIDTEGTQNTVGYGTSNRTYLTVTVTNVPSTSTIYLIYITYNQQPQVANNATHAAISTYSETNASTVGFNFSNNVQFSTLFNGFRFDTASNTSDRTYTIQHRSNSGQTNKNSIMSSGAMVVLEIDAS